MKRNTLFLFILIGIVNLSAQETIKIFKVNEDCREEYYVLKDNDTIKHGSYLKYNTESESYMFGRRIYEVGFYQDNKKAGKWRYFYDIKFFDTIPFYLKSSKDIPWCQGYYLDNTKIDLWEYFDPYGNTYLKYNYSTNDLVLYIDTLGNDLTNEKERSPIYLGWEPYLKNEILIYLYELLDPFKNRYSVKISFNVDSIGNASNFNIIDKKGPKKFGEYCLARVKSLESKWLPATKNDINTDSEVIFELNIDLTGNFHTTRWDEGSGNRTETVKRYRIPVKIRTKFDYKIH